MSGRMGDVDSVHRGYQDLTVEFFQNLITSSDPGVTVEGIQVTTGSGRGDNYTSLLYRVCANGEHADGRIWTKSFICKILPVDRARREAFKSDSLFKNEVAFYLHVLPALSNFQSSKGCLIFKETPKVYLATPNIIVLEDLKEEGYVMIDRKKSLDVQHCRVILQTLGHLHGVSLALKIDCPDIFCKQVKEQINECLFKEENEEWYKLYYQRAGENALKMLEESLPESPTSYIYFQRFKNFIKEGFFKRMVEEIRPSEPIALLCHGDCWTNNFLFRYDKVGTVSSLRMLDFQFVRYGSPALDLVYLLFNCTNRNLRINELPSLLEDYSQSLESTLTQLSCPFESVLGCRTLLKLVQEELDRCSRVGLGMAIEMIPICTCDSEEAPDLYNQGQSGDHQSEKFKETDETSSQSDSCQARIVELIVELVEKEVI